MSQSPFSFTAAGDAEEVMSALRSQPFGEEMAGLFEEVYGGRYRSTRFSADPTEPLTTVLLRLIIPTRWGTIASLDQGSIELDQDARDLLVKGMLAGFYPDHEAMGPLRGRAYELLMQSGLNVLAAVRVSIGSNTGQPVFEIVYPETYLGLDEAALSVGDEGRAAQMAAHIVASTLEG